jgi:hypothetical protein
MRRGLNGRGIMDPAFQFFVGVQRPARSNRLATHQVREVWAKTAIGNCPGNCVTVDARRFFEYSASRLNGGGRRRTRLFPKLPTC